MQDVELLKSIAATLAQIYFYDKDVQPAFSYLTNEVTMISLDGNIISGYDDVIAFLKQSHVDDCDSQLTNEVYEVKDYNIDRALIVGDYTFDVNNANADIFTMLITFCFVKANGQWKVLHIHASTSSYQGYYENRMRQIEMMNENITIGLKGTLDDEKFTFTYVNEVFCKELGYTHDEFMEMCHGNSYGSAHPTDGDRCLKEVREQLAKGDTYRIEYRIPKKDGSFMWVMDYGKRTNNENEETKIHSVVMDITDIKELVYQLEIEKERNDIISELSDDIIFDYDVKEDRLEVIYSASMNHGKREKRIIENYNKNKGSRNLNINIEDSDKITHKILMEKISKQEALHMEYQFKDKHNMWKKALIREIDDFEGHLVRVVGKVYDITSEKALELNAVTDALTGAYNRTYIKEETIRYLNEKDNDLFYGGLLIDIDYFKDINDKFGHLVGDTILINVVHALQHIFNGFGDVARLGGDEFIVLFKDISDCTIIEEKAKELLEWGRKNKIQENCEDTTSFSIGITISNKKDNALHLLYQEADIALYNAKELGRNQYVLYTEGMEYPKSIKR